MKKEKRLLILICTQFCPTSITAANLVRSKAGKFRFQSYYFLSKCKPLFPLYLQSQSKCFEGWIDLGMDRL